MLTLMDWAKRIDPEGEIDLIAELLNQTNEILDDMLWKEGNLPTGHRVTMRTGLPTVAWRLLNNGITPSKSTTAQIDEQCGMLEAWSEVDKDLAELNGNTNEFRLSEAMAFIEAMDEQMAQTLFYGNANVTPESFTGFSVRFGAISGAGNAQNVIDAGGTGSVNASIYLVVWGENSVHGIFPKGSKAGLLHEDLGEETVEVTAGVAGSRMRAYRDRWQWKAGIAMRDWRYVVRIANIDTTNLVGITNGANLFTLMIKAIHRIPNIKSGKAAFYMNRTCFEYLDIQARNAVQTGGQLKYEVVDGEPQHSFRGIPVRKVDQLLVSEARVV